MQRMETKMNSNIKRSRMAPALLTMALGMTPLGLGAVTGRWGSRTSGRC